MSVKKNETIQMKKLTFLLLLLTPYLVQAQQGMIVYERVVTYGFEVPEFARGFNVPKEGNKEVMLLFNEAESMMQDAPEKSSEVSQTDSRSKRMMAFMKMGSGSRADNETVLVSYINRDEGVMVEVRDFMSKEFRIESELPVIPWKLDGEEGEFLGYTVHKATAMIDTVAVEAWFALDIPFEVGPEAFGGLPGAILVLSMDEGRLSFKAPGVSTEGLEMFQLARPDRGDKVSRKQYERAVEDKIKEVKRLGAGRRRAMKRQN